MIYSLLTLEKEGLSHTKLTPPKDGYTHVTESLIFGAFICLSLAAAILLQFDNPYWIPISCLAVMQGPSSKHTWLRGIQRIVGTLIGLGVTWLIAYAHPSALFIALGITVLQMIIEFFVVRNYTIAVIFITILTIFLAESSGISQDTTQVFLARLVDILIGSVIGMIGGWALYYEKLHHYARLHGKKLYQKRRGSPK